MSSALRKSPKPVSPARQAVSSSVPDLEQGDCLTASEFLRRYEVASNLKKAQLIEGIVHMPSPVRFDAHAKPDGLIQGWLFSYALSRPELEAVPNATLLLDSENAVQPDAMLCSAPREGGRVFLNEAGYLCGAPELVCEIAASSATVDLHSKFKAYRRNGIGEYLVWLTQEETVRWFRLVEDDFVEMEAVDGRMESVIFPGLVLDLAALFAFDRAAMVAALS